MVSYYEWNYRIVVGVCYGLVVLYDIWIGKCQIIYGYKGLIIVVVFVFDGRYFVIYLNIDSYIFFWQMNMLLLGSIGMLNLVFQLCCIKIYQVFFVQFVLFGFYNVFKLVWFIWIFNCNVIFMVYDGKEYCFMV